MGSMEEKTDPESDEEFPFSSSSQGVGKTRAFDFEAIHIGTHANLSRQWIFKQVQIRPLRSFCIVLKAKVNVLLPFGPLAIVLHYLTGQHVRSRDITQLSFCYLL